MAPNSKDAAEAKDLLPTVGGCSQVCISNGACTTNSSPSVVSQTWHIFTAEIVQQISIYCQKVLVNGQ
jgi:hypothetical protein